MLGGSNLKLLSLLALVLQNTTVVLLLRYSHVGIDGPGYLSTTAVVMQECFKMVVCLCLIFKGCNFSISAMIRLLKNEILDDWRGTLKLGVPALLYVMQNNFLYIASASLDVATLQVTYQLKILTTAIFFVFILGKRISSLQWLSLLLLVIGVCLVQVPDNLQEAFVVKEGQDRVLGVSIVITACISSGFASVYYEKILKSATGASSIWVKNVQLGLFSLVISLITVLMNDREAVLADGFFQGYSSLVWLTLTVNSCGGLIIAVVVKYADNIMKGFATSIAIIASTVFSGLIFGTGVGPIFVPGALLVIGSVIIYGKEDMRERKRKQILDSKA